MSNTNFKIAGQQHTCKEVNGIVRTDNNAINELIDSLDKWDIKDMKLLGRLIAEGKQIKDP